MQRLIQNISGSEESAKAAPSKPKRSKSSLVFKVNRPSVYKVLEKATKNDLAQLKDVWPDLMNVLEASQKAIMNTSTPVAASPQGLVVTFDYDILCERATNDTLLLNTIGEYLEKVIGHRAELISVPAEQWPVIRQEFIKRMKEEPGDPSDVHSENTSPQEEKEETEPIVSEAFKIFGEQIVKVED